MGSRSYIGHLENGTVTFSYCHTGAYLEDNGETLLEHFNTEDKARALAHAGAMHSISGVDVDIGNNRETAESMRISEYLAFDEIAIESLFVYMHSNWWVKSCHASGREGTWHLLKHIIKAQQQAEQKTPRESMLEMMRGYQHASLQFFTGDEILDVDVICDMSREVQGVILTLTS